MLFPRNASDLRVLSPPSIQPMLFESMVVDVVQHLQEVVSVARTGEKDVSHLSCCPVWRMTAELRFMAGGNHF